VQLRCCYQTNKVVDIATCAYSGQRYIHAPWDTDIRTNMALDPPQAMQSFAIT
jgi:hypothetical protein